MSKKADQDTQLVIDNHCKDLMGVIERKKNHYCHGNE